MFNQRERFYYCVILLSIGATACDESQGFSPSSVAPNATGDAASTTTTTTTTTTTGTTPDNPPPGGGGTTSVSSPGAPVCGGFTGIGGGSGATTENNGLQASMTYIPFSDFSDCNEYSQYYSCSTPGPLNQDSLLVSSFVAGAKNVISMPNPVFLSSLDFPDQEFYEGLTTPAGPLQDNAGNTLIADFALFMQGSIMLNSGDPVWTPGNYQLAVLTDDGAILSIDPTGTGKSFKTWINNDQTRSNTLACATQTISLTAGSPIPIKLNYFQGPPVRIALMLLWRKVTTLTIPAVMSTDSSINPPINLCGYEADDAFYFSQVGNPAVPVPTSNYQTLLNDGWAPIPAANLYLPGGNTNPCDTAS